MKWTAGARIRGLEPAQNSYTDQSESERGGASGPAEGPPVPGSVDPADWNRLSLDVARVLCNDGLVDGQLQHAVYVVVRSMRRGGAPWDAVYAALTSLLGPCDEPVAPTPRSIERHASREAALVAHMQSWADCVRLEEIERNA